jgi:hypothetical protein
VTTNLGRLGRNHLISLFSISFSAVFHSLNAGKYSAGFTTRTKPRWLNDQQACA